MNQSAELVIFDFDGVIFDSVSLKRNIFIALVSEIDGSIAERLKAKLARELAAASRQEVGQWVENELKVSGIGKEICQRFAAAFERQKHLCRVVDGFPALLNDLRSRPVWLAIVSNAAQDDIVSLLARHEIAKDAFFKILAFDGESKPSKIRALLHELAVSPRRAIMFGDMPADYAAATTCGISFIRIKTNDSQPWPDGISTHENFMKLFPLNRLLYLT